MFSMQISVPYFKVNNSKYPEPVAIAIAKEKTGEYNPITLGWVMVTSGNPNMFAIAVSQRNFSLEVIRLAKSFVLAFPSVYMAEEALFFGTHSGRDIDKMAEVKLATEPAEQIESLLLTDAVANFECRLVSEHTTGDHVILVGEVIQSHLNDDPTVERLYIIGPGFKLGSYKDLV